MAEIVKNILGISAITGIKPWVIWIVYIAQVFGVMIRYGRFEPVYTSRFLLALFFDLSMGGELNYMLKRFING